MEIFVKAGMMAAVENKIKNSFQAAYEKSI